MTLSCVPDYCKILSLSIHNSYSLCALFLRISFAFHVYKPILIEKKKFPKKRNLGLFRAFKCFILSKSVPYTGNELAGDDVENCESHKCLLQISHISCNFVLVSVEILLK